MSLTLEKNKNTNFDIKNLKMDQDKIQKDIENLEKEIIEINNRKQSFI